MSIALLVSGATATLFAAMLASDGKPLPRRVSIFRADFNWKAFETCTACAQADRKTNADSADNPFAINR